MDSNMLKVANIILLACISVVLSYNNSKNDELLSVIVIYRHGDRTPIDPYPNDPYRNNSYWPVDFGQLTNAGKLQHYKLGQWLRQRYSTFLPNMYSERDIYVRSTDVDRSLMSAAANLAGLYPPIGREIWGSIKWQPIPIHSMPERDDALLAMKKKCPKYDMLFSQLLNSPYFMNITHKNHDLYGYLTRYSGTLINSLERLEYLYNIFFIETIYNFSLPEWATKIYPDKLRHWAYLSFATACYTKELARLKTGPLLNEIVQHFQNKSDDFQSGIQHKMIVFSGHDLTIANVLQSIDAFEYHCPPYASTIMFELRQTAATKKYVNIFYKNDTIPQKITLNGCDFDCDLDEFINILKPVTINLSDWKHECQLTWMNRFTPDYFNVVTIFGISGCLLLILIACIIYIKYPKMNYETNSYMQLPNDEIA